MTGEVVCGSPFAQIIRQARLVGADLVVIGRRGRRPIRRMLIGSTAARVVRYGDLPVLIVGNTPARGYERPMAAVDYDETTRRTLETLLRVVARPTQVTLVQALDLAFSGFAAPASPVAEETTFRRTVRDEAVRSARSLLARIPVRDVAWQCVHRVGDPRNVILDEAAHRDADLLAIGTHARSGIARVLVGSVAEWVVENATCDVLVARPARFTFRPIP